MDGIRRILRRGGTWRDHGYADKVSAGHGSYIAKTAATAASAEPRPAPMTAEFIVAAPVCVGVDAVPELVAVEPPFLLVPVVLDGDVEVVVLAEMPDTLIAVQTALVLGDFWLNGK